MKVRGHKCGHLLVENKVQVESSMTRSLPLLLLFLHKLRSCGCGLRHRYLQERESEKQVQPKPRHLCHFGIFICSTLRTPRTFTSSPESVRARVQRRRDPLGSGRVCECGDCSLERVSRTGLAPPQCCAGRDIAGATGRENILPFSGKESERLFLSVSQTQIMGSGF